MFEKFKNRYIAMVAVIILLFLLLTGYFFIFMNNSAAELKEIIGIVRDHGMNAIFTETNGSGSAAGIIAAETGAAVYTLDMAMAGESWLEAMYYNIDTIMPKLEKQILKYREKIYQKRKQPVDIGKAPEFIEPSEMPVVRNEDYEIAKTKKFAIEAIELKEAIVNLELTGHDFYLFLNTATNQVEAVYRRHDGTIGHLQPYLA